MKIGVFIKSNVIGNYDTVWGQYRYIQRNPHHTDIHSSGFIIISRYMSSYGHEII